MAYCINLKEINLDQYMAILESADLLPSRQVLKDDVKSKFKRLKKCSISNIEELLKELKNKQKVLEFAKESGVEVDYLTILAREIKSNIQVPNKLKDFSIIPDSAVQVLEEIGIKNTLQLFSHVLTGQQRAELADQTGISYDIILTLTHLSDLSRIRWVNHTFAIVLLKAGYNSVAEVRNADYKVMYEQIVKINREQNLYKGNIGLHDMKLCVDGARDLSIDVIC